ncbi:MAG: hypothetical protein ACREUA_00645 [Burkholderiales bacterium]
MAAVYYSLRRLSPYLGTIQHVDVEDLRATSLDGRHWQLRRKNQYGLFSPISKWGEDERHAVPDVPHANQLVESIGNCPPTPFPMRDGLESWLLNSDTGMPLALMKSCATWEDVPQGDQPPMPLWQAFAMGDDSFIAPCLQARGKEWWVKDRGALEGQINEAAFPMPRIQWFRRDPEGGGVGLSGPRLQPGMEGRKLKAEDFPELLLSDNWSTPQKAQLVREYHEWNAPLLLTHSGLKHQTRQWLEQAACRRPEKLLEIFRLIPEYTDREGLEVAMVQAKLANSAP